jgi:hypothetical protein
VAIAESPAKAYNPLFIYGGPGLGKTHLLHAIGQYATVLGNAHLVRYVSTQQFTNEFIDSLRHNRTQAFQHRYRDVDILLIDDIQFLENSTRHRRSSSTPSTPCTTPTSRSSSAPTARHGNCPPWMTAYGPASSGAYSPTSNRRAPRRESRSRRRIEVLAEPNTSPFVPNRPTTFSDQPIARNGSVAGRNATRNGDDGQRKPPRQNT